MSLPYSTVNHYCLNTSSSKQLYSFSKQRRFKTQLKALDNSTDQFYAIPSIFTPTRRSGPTFSKDRKKLFFPEERQNQSKPGPKYTTDVNSITQSVKHRKGVSIAPKRSNSSRSLVDSQKFPSPLHYQKVNQKFISLKKHQPNYSFSKQIKQLRYPQKDRVGNDSPGCKYLIQLSKLQKVYTKLTSVKTTKIVKLKEIVHRRKDLNSRVLKDRTQRNTQDVTKSIERRQTQLISNTNPQKTQINNKFKTSPRILFTKSVRQILNKVASDYPGPGQYGKFSEFARVEKPGLLIKNPISIARNVFKRDKYNNSSIISNKKRTLSMSSVKQSKMKSSRIDLPNKIK